MRVGLINDGTYPYRAGVAATWTHRLVRGLPEHALPFKNLADALYLRNHVEMACLKLPVAE